MPTNELLNIPQAGAAEIIPAMPGSGCVDPRSITLAAGRNGFISDRLIDPGIIMNPGADFGTSMTLMGADPGINPEHAVELAFGYAISLGEDPVFHDDDSDHEIGCGHAAKAASGDYEDAYELEGAQVRQARDHVIALARSGRMDILQPIMHGPHREQGVLEVHSPSLTVSPVIEGQPHFRYDKLRYVSYLAGLAAYAARTPIDGERYEVSPINLVHAANKQTGATLGIIAPGLPVRRLDLRGDNRIMEFAGNVPELRK